ncbi:MAG: GNAT family N-acetyltransferase [Proteobacteria bacterium]|nr:GNAT family N-acetyltransferase [Pseudomonadota bacterium]
MSANPVLSLYWTTGIEDLARGIDNRLVHIAAGDAGIIFGAAFGDLTVFSFCGALEDADIAHCIAVPGAVELHVPEAEAARYAAIAGGRWRQSREMLLMASPAMTHNDASGDCRDLTIEGVSEVAAFYRRHYPETVFDDYMLSMPFVGAFAGGRLVACAGTIAMAERLHSALIGHFVTAPDFRGKGYAVRLGCLLLDRLARRGFGRAYLATTSENGGAIRAYEKLGFVPIDKLIQIDLMP